MIGPVLLLIDLATGTFERFSYDVGHVVRGARDNPLNLVMIAEHDDTEAKLASAYHTNCHIRHYYSQAVKRCTEEGARMIIFDIFLLDKKGDAVDAELEGALRESKKVIIGDKVDTDGELKETKPPLRKFKDAVGADGHGHFLLNRDPVDGVVRELLLGKVGDVPAALWLAANRLGDQEKAKSLDRVLEGRSHLNHYSWEAGGVRSSNIVSLQDFITKTNRLVSLSNAVVMIGYRGKKEDEHGGPWTRFGNGRPNGVDLHATVLANLVHRDWLQRVPGLWQVFFTLTFGIVAIPLLLWLSRIYAMLAVVGLGLAMIVLSLWAQAHAGWWWTWAVIVVQVLAAVVAATRVPSRTWYDVVISYRRPVGSGETFDLTAQEYAQIFYWRLTENSGLRVFFDHKSLGTSDEREANWGVGVARAISGARCVVLLLTGRALDDCPCEPMPLGSDQTNKTVGMQRGGGIASELMFALENGVEIIPVYFESFSRPKAPPSYVEEILNSSEFRYNRLDLASSCRDLAKRVFVTRSNIGYNQKPKTARLQLPVLTS